MPRDKSKNHDKIIVAAIEEFSEYGYDKASMRRIGKRCGLTAAALYRHFDNKAALFSSLVEPALNDLNEWIEQHTSRTAAEIRKILDRVADADNSVLHDRGEISIMEDLIYPRMDEYKLLINQSGGSAYENFMDELVSEHQRRMTPYLEALKQHGFNVREITPEEMRILLTAYCKALLEPVVQGYTLEQALKYMKTIEEFFAPGWRKLMGLENE